MINAIKVPVSPVCLHRETCYDDMLNLQSKDENENKVRLLKVLTFVGEQSAANKFNCVVNSTEHQRFMGSTEELRLPLVGVMFKDMLK